MDERTPEKTNQEAAQTAAVAESAQTDEATLKHDAGSAQTDAAALPHDAGSLKSGAASSKPDAGPTITDVRILNPRSLRLEFSNGAIRLFDRFRLRGPRYIPLIAEENFMSVTVRDGDLYWEALDITCPATYAYRFSVPYDDNATAKEYVRTRRDIIQERIAIVLFPVMAIAGILGTIWWWLNN